MRPVRTRPDGSEFGWWVAGHKTAAVPVLAPGELITSAAIDSLPEVKADGGRIAYAADPSLETFQVVVRN